MEKAVGNLEPLDVAADLLRQSGAPITARALLTDTLRAVGGDPEDAQQLAALQTEISLDNRFLPALHGAWALKEWLPKPKPSRSGKALAVHRAKQVADDDADSDSVEVAEEWD